MDRVGERLAVEVLDIVGVRLDQSSVLRTWLDERMPDEWHDASSEYGGWILIWIWIWTWPMGPSR